MLRYEHRRSAPSRSCAPPDGYQLFLSSLSKVSMANLKLDNTLAGALSTIVERYKDDNQFVSVENADKLVFDELERMGYLKNLSYDFSGNAIMIPTYKAAAYFQEENDAAIVASRNNKVFETFEETYTRVKGIGNGGAGNVYEVVASDGERYALKLLNAEAARNPSKLKRFLQEARYELEGKCSGRDGPDSHGRA